jgi:hypothetical protein
VLDQTWQRRILRLHHRNIRHVEFTAPPPPPYKNLDFRIEHFTAVKRPWGGRSYELVAHGGANDPYTRYECGLSWERILTIVYSSQPTVTTASIQGRSTRSPTTSSDHGWAPASVHSDQSASSADITSHGMLSLSILDFHIKLEHPCFSSLPNILSGWSRSIQKCVHEAGSLYRTSPCYTDNPTSYSSTHQMIFVHAGRDS